MPLKNEAKTEHALDFLNRLNRTDPLDLSKMMHEDLGPVLTDMLAYYAERAGEKASTKGDSAEIAKAMIMIGYLLRAAEERKATGPETKPAEPVQFPMTIPGTYKH